jgi:hypothetical protein
MAVFGSRMYDRSVRRRRFAEVSRPCFASTSDIQITNSREYKFRVLLGDGASDLELTLVYLQPCGL